MNVYTYTCHVPIDVQKPVVLVSKHISAAGIL